MPPQGARPPATSYTRPAPSRGKRVERAGRVARCLRTRVPMGGTRNRERPCRAASSVLRTPHATNCRLRAPATSYTRPAPSRGKRVERAGRVAMSLRTWVFAAYMLYPVPRRTHFDNQNLSTSKFAAAPRNLLIKICGGPDRNLYFGLVPFHSDTLILKTSPTELRVASSALPRAPCDHGRCS